jgi:ribonuclease HI
MADGIVEEVANLYGGVVVGSLSEWSLGAIIGTNQTSEVCEVMQRLLWLKEHSAEGENVVICVDSQYAGNQLENFWKANCNKGLIETGKAVLRRVRTTRTVTFVALYT